jgi:hypothetical protein
LASGIAIAGGRSVLPVFEASEAAGGLEVGLAAFGTSWEGTCADAAPALARSAAAKSKDWFFIDGSSVDPKENVFPFDQVPQRRGCRLLGTALCSQSAPHKA